MEGRHSFTNSDLPADSRHGSGRDLRWAGFWLPPVPIPGGVHGASDANAARAALLAQRIRHPLGSARRTPTA
jgi:hypothetical protein